MGGCNNERNYRGRMTFHGSCLLILLNFFVLLLQISDRDCLLTWYRFAALYRHLDVAACCECQVPLRMARDILEAIREDVGIFEQVQQRFSDLHGSSDLGDVSALSLNNFLHSCSSCDRTRTLLHIFIVLQLTQFWLLLPQCLGILYLHNYIVGTELEYASNC